MLISRLILLVGGMLAFSTLTPGTSHAQPKPPAPAAAPAGNTGNNATEGYWVEGACELTNVTTYSTYTAEVEVYRDDRAIGAPNPSWTKIGYATQSGSINQSPMTVCPVRVASQPTPPNPGGRQYKIVVVSATVYKAPQPGGQITTIVPGAGLVITMNP